MAGFKVSTPTLSTNNNQSFMPRPSKVTFMEDTAFSYNGSQ